MELYSCDPNSFEWENINNSGLDFVGMDLYWESLWHVSLNEINKDVVGNCDEPGTWKWWGGVPELNIAMVLSANWTRTVKLNATVIQRVSVKKGAK